jgi:transposase
MNAREERGLIIAATCRLKRNDDGTWSVPSQTTGALVATYQVNLKTKACTCPDHTDSGYTCKHYFAAKIVHTREVLPDGTMIEQQQFAFTETKVTYKQDWPAYNAAQAAEKNHFQELLADLCAAIPEPPRKGGAKGGRPPAMLRDAAYICALKVYSTFSARRFQCDITDAYQSGYLTDDLSLDIAWKYLRKPEMTPIFHDLIIRSSLPLKSLEKDFAIDSTGFGSTRYERWYDLKYGVTRSKAKWMKAHVAVGVHTNCVTAAVVGDHHTGDSTQFPELAHKTAENWTMEQMSADKAYLSGDNFMLIDQLGGTAYIPFKTNSVLGNTPLWDRMFHYFSMNREEYMRNYHKRSNVESTFSAIKRKFGDAIRSRTDVAMLNEVLAKIVCHNLCCVIQEWYKHGIDPTAFGAKVAAIGGESSDLLKFPAKMTCG